MTTGLMELEETQDLEFMGPCTNTVDLEDARSFLSNFSPTESFLDPIGIIGWNSIESEILIWLLTGTPILLIGDQGVGKTYSARLLALALGVTFARYNAAQDVWEDIIGLPHPAKLMKEDTVGLPVIETQRTIWGKRLVLADEINRCNPEMQSKWLEFIANQSMMGEHTGAAWVISAMNPIQGSSGQKFLGAQLLDAALVYRYMFYLSVPGSDKLSEEHISKIVSCHSPEEFPALRVWDNPKQVSGREHSGVPQIHVPDPLEYSILLSPNFVQGAKRLQALLSIAGNNLKEITPRWKKGVSDYVSTLTKFLLSQKENNPYSIDPRKGGMIYHAILAAIAIDQTRHNISTDDIDETRVTGIVGRIIPSFFPFLVTQPCPTPEHIHVAHKAVCHMLKDSGDPLYVINKEEDPAKRLSIIFTIDGLTPTSRLLAIKKVAEIFYESTNKERQLKAASAFAIALSLVPDGLPVSQDIASNMADELANWIQTAKNNGNVTISRHTSDTSIKWIVSLAPKDTLDAWAIMFAVRDLQTSDDPPSLSQLEELKKTSNKILKESLKTLRAILPKKGKRS